MTRLDHVLHRVAPDHLREFRLELPNRGQAQHIFLALGLALCTVGGEAQVGQAGIGAINQVQVSNHSPVPQDAVIAQPQMLLLVLDQQFNRPATQVISDHVTFPTPVSAGNTAFLLPYPPS